MLTHLLLEQTWARSERSELGKVWGRGDRCTQLLSSWASGLAHFLRYLGCVFPRPRSDALILSLETFLTRSCRAALQHLPEAESSWQSKWKKRRMRQLPNSPWWMPYQSWKTIDDHANTLETAKKAQNAQGTEKSTYCYRNRRRVSQEERN